MLNQIVTIPSIPGPHIVKRWAKVVTDVDVTKDNGYAFDGRFVHSEEAVEVTEGAVVIIVDHRKHIWNKQRREWVIRQFATLHRVTNDGELEEVASADGKTWALKLRNKVAELLKEHQATEHDLLSTFSDEVLRDELTRRGYTVARGASALGSAS